MSNTRIYQDILINHVHLYLIRGPHIKYRSIYKVKYRDKLKKHMALIISHIN